MNSRTFPASRGYLSVAVVLALTAVLPGCIPVVVGGAAASGYAMGQELGPVQQVKDNATRATIAQLWEQKDPQMASGLEPHVYDGRVLITGTVANPDWRVEAVRLAWQAEGVKEVNSEIEVADKSTLSERANDTWITTRLRSAILTDAKVRSLNYSIETVNGTVYLMGSARTQGELDLVTNHARNIPNVKRVVSYVEVRPGETPHPSAPAVAAPVYQAPQSPANQSPGYQPPTAQPPTYAAPTYSAPSAPTPVAPSPGRSPAIEVTPLS